jgi:hypothetical protein
MQYSRRWHEFAGVVRLVSWRAGPGLHVYPNRRLYYLWRFVNFGALFSRCMTPIWSEGYFGAEYMQTPF